MIRLALLLLVIAMPLRAEKIVLGLSRDQVAITANFDGSEILIFGAISRDEPIPVDSKLGVIVTVAGPQQAVDVRRKARRLGIWVNAEALKVAAAPSFYAVASSEALEDVLLRIEDMRLRVSIPRAIHTVAGQNIDRSAFTDALMRIRTDQNLYQSLPGAVDLSQDTLFRTAITLPANLTEGIYTARIYLTRNGRVIDEYVTTLPVRKVGMERWLYNQAHDNALLYGLMSLAIAIAAGWGASALFGLLRR